MSRARKHVLQEALAGEIEAPGPDQYIVRALGARGGNLIEVRLNRPVSAAASLSLDPITPLPQLIPPLCSRLPPQKKTNKQNQVERPDRSTCMVLLPAKFHKKMWVKRGGFLVARLPPEAAASGARLAGEVERVLYEQEVSALKGMEGVWPKEFDDEEEKVNGAGAATSGGAGQGGSDAAGPSRGGKEKKSGGDSDSDSDDSGLPPLEENPNRRRQTYATSSSESDSDEDEEEDENEEEEDEK